MAELAELAKQIENQMADATVAHRRLLDEAGNLEREGELRPVTESKSGGNALLKHRPCGRPKWPAQVARPGGPPKRSAQAASLRGFFDVQKNATQRPGILIFSADCDTISPRGASSLLPTSIHFRFAVGKLLP